MANILNKTIMQVSKNERIYELECSNDAPLGEVFDALCEMQLAVIERMSETVQQDKQIKEDNFPEPKEDANV